MSKLSSLETTQPPLETTKLQLDETTKLPSLDEQNEIAKNYHVFQDLAESLYTDINNDIDSRPLFGVSKDNGREKILRQYSDLLIRAIAHENGLKFKSSSTTRQVLDLLYSVEYDD